MPRLCVVLISGGLVSTDIYTIPIAWEYLPSLHLSQVWAIITEYAILYFDASFKRIHLCLQEVVWCASGHLWFSPTWRGFKLLETLGHAFRHLHESSKVTWVRTAAKVIK